MVEPKAWPDGVDAGRALRDEVFSRDVAGAERTFAQIAKQPASEAYAALLPVVQGDIDVHRIVLAWRAWDLRRLTGEKHAHTLLRQSVRYCVNSELGRAKHNRPEPGIRSTLPELLEKLDLLDGPRGEKKADDAWLEELSGTIFAADRETAAAAAGAALAEGFGPEAVGEAVSLAGNKLLLHDPGRQDNLTAEKPRGSVHGASVGVHASDAANAWRNVARVSSARNTAASLIVGAYHTAGQSDRVGPAPIPFHETAESTAQTDGEALLRATEEAFRSGDQLRACGLVERYGTLGHPSEPAFDLMLRFAVSEDGALHAEKYFRTVVEEFGSTRPAFRWRHLVGLARVTASEHGHPAPGLAEARRLLNV